MDHPEGLLSTSAAGKLLKGSVVLGHGQEHARCVHLRESSLPYTKAEWKTQACKATCGSKLQSQAI